jgi:hypothetical protein
MSSDKSEVEGWMHSQIVGAMRRKPGIESCGLFILAMAVLAGALMRVKRLIKLSMKASILNCNDGGMLGTDKEYSSTSEQANLSPCSDFDLISLCNQNKGGYSS